MAWFFIALIGSLLVAFANHIDKYLISKYLKNGEVGSLIIFSALFSIVALPIVIVIHPTIFNVSVLQGIVLMLNGMLVVVAILCYFYALHKDEATFVVPFYQTIPIFAFILGYFILGETVSQLQTLGSFIIIAGALILSFELGSKKIRFKKSVVVLMLTASFLYAINGVVFKLIAIQEGFWPSTFWGLVGHLVIGLGFLSFIPKYRRQFFEMIQKNRVAVIGLNSLSETLFISSEAIIAYATLLAPVALVLLVNAFQPVFVFIIGIFLTLFLPHISQESTNRKILIQKIAGICLILFGSYFIGR